MRDLLTLVFSKMTIKMTTKQMTLDGVQSGTDKSWLTTDGKTICPTCDGEYSSIASHWSKSDCFYPKITNRQREIIKGLLVGDGSLDIRDNKNSRVRVTSINGEFLGWLSDEFGIFSNSIHIKRTKEQSMDKIEKFHGENGNIENYHTIYRFQTTSLPELKEFEHWYPDRQSTLPQYTVLTPMMAKIWYVSDGSVSWADGNYGCVRFHTRTQDLQQMKDMFESCGFGGRTYDASSNDGSSTLVLKKEDSRRFLEWIGESISGFEYKFEVEDRDKYDQLKEDCYDNYDNYEVEQQ